MKIELYVHCPLRDFDPIGLKECFECGFLGGVVMHYATCDVECGIDELMPEEDHPEILRLVRKELYISGKQERIVTLETLRFLKEWKGEKVTV